MLIQWEFNQNYLKSQEIFWAESGHFDIYKVALPIPYTTMTLPEDVSFQSSALSVTGGFEINYLTSRIIQDD